LPKRAPGTPRREMARGRRRTATLAALVTCAARTVVDTIGERRELAAFAALLNATGLASTLSDAARSFTVFAPTNAAFDALPAVDALSMVPFPVDDDAPSALTQLVAHHVVVGENAVVYASDFRDGAVLGMLDARFTTLTWSSVDAWRLDGAAIREVDLCCSDNGVVHVLGAVLGLGDDESALPPADDAAFSSGFHKDDSSSEPSQAGLTPATALLIVVLFLVIAGFVARTRSCRQRRRGSSAAEDDDDDPDVTQRDTGSHHSDASWARARVVSSSSRGSDADAAEAELVEARPSTPKSAGQDDDDAALPVAHAVQEGHVVCDSSLPR